MDRSAERGVKRVAFVLQSTLAGGMERHCSDLATELSSRGLAVMAVVPRGGPFDEFARRIRAGGAEVVRLDTDARRGRFAQLAALVALARALLAWKPDVVHLQTGGATGGLAVVGLARLVTRATVVLTEHDVPVAPGLRQRLARRALDALLHALVAVSRRNAGLRGARLPTPRRKFASILNGVLVREAGAAEREANRRRIRDALDIRDDAIVVGSVVRLVEGKGLPDLLRATALLPATMELLLVGDGPLREELGALAAELGIAARVRFAGHQRDPSAHLDAMDVFALAVPAGSMSIALLEAMAQGVPPVITFCGPEEAVIREETGLCAPPHDPAGLAAALARLVADPALRARLGAAAGAHVRRHFSVARVADDLLDLYAEARRGTVPARLRASAPPDPRPGAARLT